MLGRGPAAAPGRRCRARPAPVRASSSVSVRNDSSNSGVWAMSDVTIGARRAMISCTVVGRLVVELGQRLDHDAHRVLRADQVGQPRVRAARRRDVIVTVSAAEQRTGGGLGLDGVGQRRRRSALRSRGSTMVAPTSTGASLQPRTSAGTSGRADALTCTVAAVAGDGVDEPHVAERRPRGSAVKSPSPASSVRAIPVLESSTSVRTRPRQLLVADEDPHVDAVASRRSRAAAARGRSRGPRPRRPSPASAASRRRPWPAWECRGTAPGRTRTTRRRSSCRAP